MSPCRCGGSDETLPVTVALDTGPSTCDDGTVDLSAGPREAAESRVEPAAAANPDSNDGAAAHAEALPEQISLDLLEPESFDQRPAPDACAGVESLVAEFPPEATSNGDDRVEPDRANASPDERFERPAVAVQTPVSTAALGPRELIAGLIGVVGGAFFIFGLLSSPGGAAHAPAPVIAPISATASVGSTVASQPTSAPVQGVRSAKADDQRPMWTSNADAWVGADRHSAAFEVAAIDKVQVWMHQVRPTLVVRCRAKTIEAFVFTDSPARMEPQDGNHTVRIRFDGQPEVTERWPDSAEHDALFSPNGAKFVGRLVGARSLTFAFSPHNSGPVTASFEIGGLAGHLASAVKQCGWKPEGAGM